MPQDRVIWTFSRSLPAFFLVLVVLLLCVRRHFGVCLTKESSERAFSWFAAEFERKGKKEPVEESWGRWEIEWEHGGHTVFLSTWFLKCVYVAFSSYYFSMKFEWYLFRRYFTLCFEWNDVEYDYYFRTDFYIIDIKLREKYVRSQSAIAIGIFF